jgi:Domain of unknown function (DUF4440)
MTTRRHPSAFVFFAVATMLSATSLAKDNAREALLKTAEIARFGAQVSADAGVLDKLLDDGLEYTHSNGDQDTKASFIESLTSGKRDYVSTVPTFESVRIFGNVGVIRGKAKVTVADNGQSKDLSLGYTDIWLWKDGRWQMTAWRSVRLPDSPVK